MEPITRSNFNLWLNRSEDDVLPLEALVKSLQAANVTSISEDIGQLPPGVIPYIIVTGEHHKFQLDAFIDSIFSFITKQLDGGNLHCIGKLATASTCDRSVHHIPLQVVCEPMGLDVAHEATNFANSLRIPALIETDFAESALLPIALTFHTHTARDLALLFDHLVVESRTAPEHCQIEGLSFSIESTRLTPEQQDAFGGWLTRFPYCHHPEYAAGLANAVRNTRAGARRIAEHELSYLLGVEYIHPSQLAKDRNAIAKLRSKVDQILSDFDFLLSKHPARATEPNSQERLPDIESILPLCALRISLSEESKHIGSIRLLFDPERTSVARELIRIINQYQDK